MSLNLNLPAIVFEKSMVVRGTLYEIALWSSATYAASSSSRLPPRFRCGNG